MNQNPIGLLGEENLYSFAPNTIMWTDQLGWSANNGLWGGKGLPKMLSNCDLVEQVLSLILCCRINWKMQKSNVVSL